MNLRLRKFGACQLAFWISFKLQRSFAMQVTYHVATSADMYIARPDGDVSWLDQSGIDVDETGIKEFMATVDGIAMGRNTYDFVYDFGSWPYGDMPSWVCTSKPLEILPGAILKTSSSVSAVVDSASEAGVQHMWLIGGGQLASAFLERKLITDICITVLPIKLGDGIPLFARHKLSDIPVRNRTSETKTGFTQLHLRL